MIVDPDSVIATITFFDALYLFAPVLLVLGKAAAELLERSLDYSIDAYDFDDLMQDCIHDIDRKSVV